MRHILLYEEVKHKIRWYKDGKFEEEYFEEDEEQAKVVLPDHWCLKITKENKPIFQLYNVGIWPVGHNYLVGAYYYPDNVSLDKLRNSVEITIDDFLRSLKNSHHR